MKTENTDYLVDTSAWIEFFKGSEKGKAVASLLKNANKTVTSSHCIGELAYWSFVNGYDFQKMIVILRARSKIVDATTNNWVEAAHKKAQLRPKRKAISLYDTLLLSLQNMTGLIIVTADNDFRGLPNTIML